MSVGSRHRARDATRISRPRRRFLGAPTAFGAAPNTQASAVDIALPGVLPVLEPRRGRACDPLRARVGGTINRRACSRKNYFYPDLPKGYQISQYEIPVVQAARSNRSPSGGDRIALTRAHLEEDAGSRLHEDFPRHDRHRPEPRRHAAARDRLRARPAKRGRSGRLREALHALVTWIGICDGNMQEGSFRCDANVSVRRPATPARHRCEIKNLNSFRFMQQAIEFEVRAPDRLLEHGGNRRPGNAAVRPEQAGTRVPMRTKGRQRRITATIPESGPAPADDSTEAWDCAYSGILIRNRSPQ
jgi:aspartyl-tRNA(Asn)/glutamyl-tRNA(Gln) amidotransferase subunit B